MMLRRRVQKVELARQMPESATATVREQEIVPLAEQVDHARCAKRKVGGVRSQVAARQSLAARRAELE